MKLFSASLAIAAAFVLGTSAAQAHERDRDRVTRVDRYHNENVVHYDHHHRSVYVDDYGRVIGSRTKHHDHHYVEPRRSSHHDSDRHDSRRGGFRFFGR